MLILNRRKRLFASMENVYFMEDPTDYKTDCDVVLFYSAGRKPKGGFHGKPSYTLQIDLRRSKEELFNDMSKSTRRELRRALENPELKYAYITNPTPSQLEMFCDCYDQFAGQRGIASTDRAHLKELMERGILALSYVRGLKDEIYCGTADIITPERCYGAYAFTNFRNHSNPRLLGRANRLLYWNSMIYGRQAGCRVCDMGGIGKGAYGRAMDGIDAFKKGFGGQVVMEYDIYKGYTLRGKVLAWLLHRIKRLKAR